MNWKKLLDADRKGLKNYLLPGYVFNKNIFRTYFVFIFILLLVTMASTGFDFDEKVYFECPINGPSCENPFYISKLLGMNENICFKNPLLCESEFFPPGYTIGSKPSFLIRTYGYFVLIGLFIALVLNHSMFNKDYTVPRMEDE